MNEAKNKRLVAVVDSDGGHRQKVCKALMSFYDLMPLDNARDALQKLSHAPPALILLNSHADPWDPEGFVKEARGSDALKNTPIIYIAESETDPHIEACDQAGANGYLSRPYTRSALTKTISDILSSGLEKSWEKMDSPQGTALLNSIAVFRDISDVMMSGETVQFSSVTDNCAPLVEAIERGNFLEILDGVRMHDDYTYAHSMRVATLLTLLGNAAGFNEKEQLLLAGGGLLHDVGKMRIPHNILNKPGKLTEEEFEVMKSHVPETVDYLRACENIPKAVFIIAEQHHEKIDGTGYPHGLQGKALNELARMAAVVDVFSALTDRRVYKEPMEAGKAMDTMVNDMPSHLDPHFVKMFRGVLIDTGVLK